MKKNIATIVFSIVLIGLLFTSCEEKKAYENLEIRLQKEVQKTILPQDYPLEISSYEITCTNNQSSIVHTFNTSRNSILLESIEVGEYTIVAVGKNSDNIALIRGTTNFVLSETSTMATVVLGELIGTGGVNITFNWESVAVNNPSLNLTVTGEDNNYREIFTPNINNGAAILNISSLSSGSYTVIAELFNLDVKIAGAVQAFRIVDNEVTAGTISINVDEKPTVVGQLTLINKAGVPFSCVVEGVSNNQIVPAQSDLTLNLNIEELNSTPLTIKWYLDGIELTEVTDIVENDCLIKGQSVTFKPSPGEHRLDVIAKTNMLGSTGSTTLVFLADILGQTGEPILAGVIEDGETPISGRNTMEFLPDGRLIIASDGHKRASINTIVNNELHNESVITYSENVKEIMAMCSNDVVAFLHDDSSTRYTYSNANKSLTTALNDEGRALKNYAPALFNNTFGLIRNGIYSSDYYGVSGFINVVNRTGVSFRHLTNSNLTINSADSFIEAGTGFQLATNMFASSYDGGENIFYLSTTGEYVVSKSIYGNVVNVSKSADNDLINASAIIVLPSDNNNIYRFILAIDDAFHIVSANVNDQSAEQIINKADETITSVQRNEGTNLGTTKMLLSRNGNYLYALNTSDNSISTYKVTSNSLEFVSITDLSFAPANAAISANGRYLFACPLSSNQITMFKIKTT